MQTPSSNTSDDAAHYLLPKKQAVNDFYTGGMLLCLFYQPMNGFSRIPAQILRPVNDFTVKIIHRL